MVIGYRAALDAGYDVVVTIDADGQMHIDDLPALVCPIELGDGRVFQGQPVSFGED